MSGGRAKKRARVKEPEPAAEAAQHGAAASASAAQAAGVLDALPDALLGDIFRALGPRASWPLRGVCSRWQRLVEETDWASVELQMDGGRAGDWAAAGGVPKPRRKAAASERSGERAFSRVSTLLEERRLRLVGGGSVALRAELPRRAISAPQSGKKGRAADAELKRSHQLAAAAACRLLAVAASSGVGPAPARPREVVIELSRRDGLLIGVNDDVDFVRTFLLDLLRALAPPGDVPSGLQSLSVGCNVEPERYSRQEWLPWPAPAELQPALAPFGQLRSLDLFFGPLDEGITKEAAAVVAAACPLLASLSVRPRPMAVAPVLAALAPLAHLQNLAVLVGHPHICDAVAFGIVTIAGGAAGKSLRSLAFLPETEVYAQGAFPRRKERIKNHLFEASDDALLALGSMPHLESVRTLFLTCSDVKKAAVLALGRSASLRELHVFLYANEVKHARALAEALTALPRIERLFLELSCSDAGPGARDALAFLRSAGARRALTDLRLIVYEPVSEALAEALAALPALRRLEVAAHPVCWPVQGALPPRPREILGRLRPDVAVTVCAF
eukprot:tig00001177_g7372.t1